MAIYLFVGIRGEWLVGGIWKVYILSLSETFCRDVEEKMGEENSLAYIYPSSSRRFKYLGFQCFFASWG